MKKIFSSPNVVEVGLVQGMLETANIACEMRNDSSSQALGATMAIQPELWIENDADYEEARALIEKSAIVATDAGEPRAS